VFCRNCGHQNPEQHGFCGMCGNKLAGEAPRDAARAPDPVETPREPEKAEPAAPETEPAQRSDKWWVDEEKHETTISGPSFLGLSSSDSAAAGGYSYLFEEEDEEEQPSHTGLWVLLALMLVLGGVLYAKWQPIRYFMLTTSLSHSRPQPPPAPETKNEPPSASATSTPASQPEQSQAVQPSQELSPADQPSSTADKPDDSLKPPPARARSQRAAGSAAKPPEAKSAAANKRGGGRESADPASKEKPAAQTAPTPQGNASGELVSSGEKYLYARGVARNCEQAISYFNAAAAQQNPQAFSHLGTLYATGECLPMDRAVAYAWFRRAYAREPGNRYFEQNLIMLWREMTPAERQRATGRQ